MHVYIYQHIPFLRLKLNSQPPVMAGTQISSFLCAWSLHSPGPNYQSSHTHVCKYLSLLTVIVLYGLQICLCVHLGGKEGRRWRISDQMDTLVKENLRYRWTVHMNLARDYILQS